MKNLGVGYILLFLPWIFFGGLIGIHSFYAGKVGKGLTQVALWVIFWALWFGGSMVMAAIGSMSGVFALLVAIFLGLGMFTWGVVDAIRMKSDLGL